MHENSSTRNEALTGSDTIANIDAQLLKLLADRIKCLQEQGSVPELPESLNSIALRIEQANIVGLDSTSATSWIQHADSICRQAQSKRSPVAFLGPIYSYSYLAAVKFFGLGADLVPVATIAAAFDEVDRGQAAFGVVPVENSTDGRVVDTLGMFARSPVEICGEVLLPIHHCLLGLGSRSDIKEVHSKPQALSQCRQWLAEHLPNAQLAEVTSTASAASTAAKRKDVAAIASREAGIHQGLQIIDENIEDNQSNVTRFAIIGNRRPAPQGQDKTSLMFQLVHKPGALASAMLTFQSAQINLTWIESFPLPNCPNEYLFFVELEGHRDHSDVADAIRRLREIAVRLDVLGSYPKGKA